MIIHLVGDDWSGTRELMAGFVYLNKDKRILYSEEENPFSFCEIESFKPDNSLRVDSKKEKTNEALSDMLAGEVENSVVVFDQSYFFFDSRCTQTSINRLVSYLAMTSRQKKNTLIFRSATRDSMDKRIRRNTDKCWQCYPLLNSSKILVKEEYHNEDFWSYKLEEIQLRDIQNLYHLLKVSYLEKRISEDPDELDDLAMINYVRE